ncbi:MAG: porin family protein [Melioribacteraceae bacterium]|nr:porin family protein [Melioribacteraceae bacterium]
MRKNVSIILIALFLIPAGIGFAQSEPGSFNLSFSYSYITSSKIFLRPNSTDPFERGSHENIDGIYGYGGEVRYFIGEGIIVGLSLESINRTENNFAMNLGGYKIKMTDGYQIYPVELSVYYYLPFSTTDFKFFMGGGVGAYFGNYVRDFHNVSIDSKLEKFAFGIHVAVGMDYQITENLGIRGQMRFRDPELKFNNTYKESVVILPDRTLLLPVRNFDTAVNVDGIIFMIGATYTIN